MSRELAITISQLSKTFNGREVIHQCNMTVEKGTIYGFLGKNGAGKTTIFKMILGLIAPTFGKATVLGMDSVKDNLEILRKTGSLIEIPVFYEHLSATENLKMHMEYMGGRSRDMEEALQYERTTIYEKLYTTYIRANKFFIWKFYIKICLIYVCVRSDRFCSNICRNFSICNYSNNYSFAIWWYPCR